MWLNGCTGSERRGRSSLLPSFLVVPWGLGKLALVVLDVDVGYGLVLVLGDFVPWAATRVSEDAFDTLLPYGFAEHVLDVILDEDVVWVLFHEESRSNRERLTT